MDEFDNRHSGFCRLLVRWLGTVKTSLKMLDMDVLWTQVLEAVCKRD